MTTSSSMVKYRAINWILFCFLFAEVGGFIHAGIGKPVWT
jgi:hypothetical protein